MGRIKQLDYTTAVRIAAGEVIDRPASVVRELLDNSIDAGASLIYVHISDGGKGYIEVKDNGSGMDGADLEMCYKNHTTSKINDFDDISRATTLGFRGEALSSIAEVSRLTILSRESSALSGNKLEVEFGKFLSLTETGMNTGTTVRMSDLFAELPARKKFLGHESTELRHIQKEMIKKALPFHQTGFNLVSNGEEKFSAPPKNTVLERIADFFPDTVNYLIPVEYISDNLKIYGFISQSSFIRPNRMYQYLFVNRRAVEWKNFYFAVSNVYGNLIPKGHFPAAFIFLDIDPARIDFNVHPMKREVRFENENHITHAIQTALKEALFSDDGISEADDSVIQFSPYEQKIASAISGFFSSHGNDKTGDEQFTLKFKNRPERDPGLDFQITPETAPDNPSSPPSTPEYTESRFIGIAFNTFIILEEGDRLIMIDQHAAHERIRYEQIHAQYRESGGDSQELLIPINFDTPVEVTDDLKSCIPDLEKMGFGVEHFGGNTFVIRSVPDYIAYPEAAEVVMGFVESLQENRHKEIHSADFIDEAIKQMACKHSVRAGDSLSKEEAQELLQNLLQTSRPFSCPHGRPTMFSLSRQDIEKQFKRMGFS